MLFLCFGGLRIPAADSLLAGISLLVLAVAEAGWAFYVRNKVNDGQIGVGAGRLPALAVARSVVVAKASAWLGTLMTGWWMAMLVYILPRRAQLAAAAADTRRGDRGRMRVGARRRRAVASALL